MKLDSQNAGGPGPDRAWICPRCRTRTEAPEPGRCRNDGWRLIVDRRGTRIGPFEVVGFLGVGANGTVWQALDGPARRIALKLLHARMPGEAQRFERGARLAETLIHPHIARTFGFGRIFEGADELHYVDMELLEGETLATRQARIKSFAPVDAVHLVDQVLQALEHTHAQNIVHRDLKPSNLFITEAQQVKLLDFGIAKVAGGPERSENSVVGPFPDEADDVFGTNPAAERGEVTGQHKICGTPEYMAPEQIIAGPSDVRSDLYAVGVILYKLLTGTLPFHARTRVEIYHQHIHAPPPAFPAALGVPPALEAAVQRALAKVPDARFASAGAMREALHAAVAPHAGSSRPTQAPENDYLSAEAQPSPDHSGAPFTPAPPRRSPGRRRAVAVGFFVASLVILATVLVTKLAAAG